jgi:acetoin utilization deacetylase AcuC-like enzyme
VRPALEGFEPDLIVISAGQDGAACDPMGRMSLTTEGFRRMTRQLRKISEQHCAGHIIAIQEGGYSLDHMPFCILAIVEELAGLPQSFERDPLEIDAPTCVQQRGVEAIEQAARGTQGVLSSRRLVEARRLFGRGHVHE